MNNFALLFFAAAGAALLLVPRRWAPLPLLLGACYMIRGQGVELGVLSFSVMRLLIGVGLLRVVLRGERPAGRLNTLDLFMAAWSAWLVLSSLFYTTPSTALVYRLGLVYDAGGIYLLIRFLCRSFDDIEALCRFTALLLVPVGLEMLYEKLTLNNLFYTLAGQPIPVYIRDGTVRAQGAFAHPILAGTTGAVCLPLAAALWRRHRKTALAGIAACAVMVVASASSGPILSMLAALAGLFMVRRRLRLRSVRWALVGGYVALDLIMRDPAYFILARIDLTGRSTGWHRARLIQSALEHFSEWWMAGTEYTRHWMPTGLTSTAQHTDITNHYLQMGVWAGLPLLLLFVAVMAAGFSFVGRALRQTPGPPPEARFTVWALGASLFAHAVTFMSVSYFDQTFVFLYLALAAVATVYSAAPATAAAESAPAEERNRIVPTSLREDRRLAAPDSLVRGEP